MMEPLGARCPSKSALPIDVDSPGEGVYRKGKVAAAQEEGGKPDAMEVDGEEKVDEKKSEHRAAEEQT